MGIDKVEFQNALTNFFIDCETLLSSFKESIKYNSQIEYEYQSNGKSKQMNKSQKKVMIWNSIFFDFLAEIKKLESADKCAEIIRQHFKLKPFYNVNIGELEGNELFLENKNHDISELCTLFFLYKVNYQIFSITLEEYVKFIVDRCFSSNLYCKKTARLLGFNSEIEPIKLGNVIIRTPDDKELSKIVNDSANHSFPISITPIFEIAFGPYQSNVSDNEYWIFKDEEKEINKPQYFSQIINSKNIRVPAGVIDPEIYRVILSLRLFGNYSGIRTIFRKSSFNRELINYEVWDEYAFMIESNLHPLCNIEFGKYPPLKKNEILNKGDIENLKRIYHLIEEYQNKKISYIDQSLEHYFLSYEQKYPAYAFTELMLAFESLFGELIPSTDDDLISLINDLKNASNDKEALKRFKKFINRNSAQKSIKRLKLLLKIPKNDKVFGDFFYNSDKTGCYDLRNSLLHGNIGLEYQEISNKVPQLTEYIRQGILTIIKPYVNGELKITDSNYFEELDKFIGNK